MTKKNPRILTDSGELYRPLNTRRLKTELRAYETESRERFESVLMRNDVGMRRVANSGYAKPVNIVKRTIYSLGIKLFDTERRKTSKERQKTLIKYLEETSHPSVEDAGHLSARMPPIADNPFFWMYQLTFFTGVGEERPAWMLTRDEVSKHSRELYFAYKNEVPPEHLIGLIMQVGARDILTYCKRCSVPTFLVAL